MAERPEVDVDLPEGMDRALSFGLADAVFSRRSRRVGLGMDLPEGGLSHRSRFEPVPLSEAEEAFLVWLGTGTTGLALADLPPDGLSWMHGWNGRAWPCSCNAHSTELFYTNDEGLHLVRLREDGPVVDGANLFAGKGPEGVREAVVDLFRANRTTIEPGRADLPEGEPGVLEFNAWNANKPGTSLFIPVTNTTIEYLTLLFIYFDEHNRFSVVDELTGSRCGLDRWVESGRLGAVEMSLFDIELRVLTTLNVEGAFIAQNMSLALQALGLGGWAFTGFLPHHVLGVDPAHRGLGFEFVRPEATPRRLNTPAPVGRKGVMEGFCPPFVGDMSEAVDRFLAEREVRESGPMPYRHPDDVLAGRSTYSDETIEIVTTFAQYVLDTYGRFPAFLDPMFVRLVIQAHHLDTEFYDEHYGEGAYGATHRDHFALWHPEYPDGPPRRRGSS